MVVGLVSFYVTYVSYRNLKNFLPLVNDSKTHDLLLHSDRQGDHVRPGAGDRAAPAARARTTPRTCSATVYLLFLPISPASLIVFLVWSRNISYGYWYATVAVPRLGAGHGQLLRAADPRAQLRVPVPLRRPRLDRGERRSRTRCGGGVRTCSSHPLTTDSIQSVAGFASLHVGIILTLALVTHYTVRHAVIRWAMWAFFGADRGLHAVLRLALHRRRHRRRGDRDRRGLAGRSRDRPEVRATRPRVAPDDLDVERPGATRTTRTSRHTARRRALAVPTAE